MTPLFLMQLISIIKLFSLGESQVAGNKLIILSRKGCSHREFGTYVKLKGSREQALCRASRKNSQTTGNRPPRVLVSLSHGEGGKPQEAALELLSQEHPATCDPRTWELPLPPSLVLRQYALS